MLTPKEYASLDQSRCPNCGSDEIEGDSVTIEAGHAYQECYCLSCEATWEDTYNLTGYRGLSVPKDPPCPACGHPMHQDRRCWTPTAEGMCLCVYLMDEHHTRLERW